MVMKSFWAGCIFALGLGATGLNPAEAATLQITEIYHDEAGVFPEYVEVFYTGISSFELIVFNATVNNTTSIYSVIPVTPSADDNTIVIHASPWPTDVGYDGQRLLAPDLVLGGPAAARRLVLFDGPTGIPVSALGLNQSVRWPTTVNAVEAIDLIYTPVWYDDDLPSAFGPIDHRFAFEMEFEEAATRHIASGNYQSAFSIGTTTYDTLLPDGWSINPTFVNVAPPSNGGGDEQAENTPAPQAAGAIVIGLITLASGRSRRAGRPAGRRREGSR